MNYLDDTLYYEMFRGLFEIRQCETMVDLRRTKGQSSAEHSDVSFASKMADENTIKVYIEIDLKKDGLSYRQVR